MRGELANSVMVIAAHHSVSGWWLILPLVVIGVGAWCFALGKAVGEDPVQQEHAYNDGYDTGEQIGYMRAIRDMEDAPPMAGGLGGTDEPR